MLVATAGLEEATEEGARWRSVAVVSCNRPVDVEILLLSSVMLDKVLDVNRLPVRLLLLLLPLGTLSEGLLRWRPVVG